MERSVRPQNKASPRGGVALGQHHSLSLGRVGVAARLLVCRRFGAVAQLGEHLVCKRAGGWTSFANLV